MEKALSFAASNKNTPVIGFSSQQPALSEKEDHPFYLRTNRVGLEAGVAIAAVLKSFDYTRIFLALNPEASQTSTMKKGILAQIPQAELHEEFVSPCLVSLRSIGHIPFECAQDFVGVFRRWRLMDPRVLVHESGVDFGNQNGLITTFVLLLGVKDFLGPKVLFIFEGPAEGCTRSYFPYTQTRYSR